jgi:hypothetical protein
MIDLEPGNDRARQVEWADRARRVQWACLAIILLLGAWALWEAYGPAPRFPVSQLAPSTPASELPLAKAKVFLQHLTWGRSTPWALGMVFLLLAAVTVREARREDVNDDAPRLFAALVGLQAVLMAGAWLAMYAVLTPAARVRVGAPSLYYLVVGVFGLTAAVYLFFGRPAARSWYGWGLAVAWGWSFVEFGPGQKQFWMQVGLPTLIGLYLFSWRVSGRLVPATERG